MNNPRQLTEHERAVLMNALRCATSEYREIAVRPDIIGAGLNGQFERQAHEAAYLQDILENADKIIIE